MDDSRGDAARTKARPMPKWLCHQETAAAAFSWPFAVYEPDDVVIHNFLHDRAVQCTNCNLTLPEMDPAYPDELVDIWNERRRKAK